MKIFSTIFLTALMAASIASAKEGLYVGVDYLGVEANHQYTAHVNQGPENDKSSQNSSGFGLNVGYKAVVANKMYVAPEIFYDHLNSIADDFYVAQGAEPSSSKLKLKDRYGAKINFGYEIISKTNLFVNLGLARNNYQQNWDSSENQRNSSSVLAPIYGVGISLDLTNNLSAKFAYDRQSFTVRYLDNGFRDKINLDVFRVGMAYSF